jgi:spermidine/putrescine transport system substrate-binding protein
MSGETVMHQQWSRKRWRRASRNPPLDMSIPGGIIGWMDNVAVPTGAPDLRTPNS